MAFPGWRVVIVLWGACLVCGRDESFQEELLIRPLSDGNLLAHLQFTTALTFDATVEPVCRFLCFEERAIVTERYQ
jgi:hypothetical protein